MADDDWTFVPRKKQGRVAQKSPVSHTPVSIKDATLEDIAREYGVKSRIWKRSEARQQLQRTLAHLKPDAGWKIQTAVCLGTGSFTRDNFDCRKRTMEQFAMFVDTIDYLRDIGEHIGDIYVQEGWYNELDKKFLKTLGMIVPEMKPGSYPIPDCGPATKYFGPNTFVCELYIEHSEGTIRTLTQSQVPLLMSTSRRMCEKPVEPPVVEAAASVGLSALMLATCVPANAKNRNITVPTNSAKAETMSIVMSVYHLGVRVIQATYELEGHCSSNR